MGEASSATSHSADARKRALRRALGAEWQKLRVVAEDVLGAESRIDLVAVGTEGELLLVLVGEAGRDLELVARGLAQRVWVEAHLPDWLKLAPDLGVRPEVGVAVVLLCPSFGAEALAAARAVGSDRLTLATCRFSADRSANGGELHAWIDPIELVPVRARADGAGSAPPRFRTGLTDADLGLASDETAALNGPPAPREHSIDEFRSR